MLLKLNFSPLVATLTIIRDLFGAAVVKTTLLNQFITFCYSVGKSVLLIYKLCIVSMENIVPIQ